jgi:ubiquinone/menaquinone biosynthesis C-methylase UbiE
LAGCNNTKQDTRLTSPNSGTAERQMVKADYSKIALHYDRSRLLSEKNIFLWLKLIEKRTEASKGTGRFSLPLASRLGLNVTGLDSSAGMLAKAKQKDSDSIVNWVLADASALPYPDSSFDIVFMSHLLHHVNSPLEVLKECDRVLIHSGVVIIRYGAMEQIRNDVVHMFFPQTIEIDERRTPTRQLTEKWLVEAGFVGIFSEEVIQQTYQTSLEHLDAVRAKSTSVLSMISEESFQTGLRCLEEYIIKNPDNEWLLIDKMTLTVGNKR